jgi:hypothetical protein
MGKQCPAGLLVRDRLLLQVAGFISGKSSAMEVALELHV